MCGIAGAIVPSPAVIQHEWLTNACKALSRRGPDHQAIWQEDNAGLAHTRLSIIDTSSAAHQPFTDRSGRYVIVFNGEIFNFRELRKNLEANGLQLSTTGDTEVLLNLYILYGKACLQKLVGFFAFAIYDRQEKCLFAARDRMGIKPFYYTHQDGLFCFASEMKGLGVFPFNKNIDQTALSLYFQLNYIPGPLTIYKGVHKLMPAHCLTYDGKEIIIEQYYEIPAKPGATAALSYEQQQQRLRELMEESVRMRLVSDVPLGAFLSGGIDSSVIAGLASRHNGQLNTFSIGFKDQGFFDETDYASLVAKHFNTNHTVFKLTNEDLQESLHSLLAYIDEPFADSSALLVNLLSKFTRQHVTVALSGDGGDELFAGYNKHHAEWRLRQGGLQSALVGSLLPVWKLLPKSRHGKWGNLFRQLERYSEGTKLSAAERYWRWCSLMTESDAEALLLIPRDEKEYNNIKKYYSATIKEAGSLNEVLLADVNLVLPNDMLTKVDLMSMANSLEVRVPFLDHRVVEFAFSLPASSKINARLGKRIVQDAFREMLPEELYNRPKRGFEAPLLQWMRTDLKSMILNDLLEDGFIREQQIFAPEVIRNMKQKLFSTNPGDVHAHIWALIVFQYWYKNFHLKHD
jgi:asparagine synthase (glutamine-hydrolysing)